MSIAAPLLQQGTKDQGKEGPSLVRNLERSVQLEETAWKEFASHVR